MEKRVLAVLLMLGAIVASGYADVTIRGVLEAGPQPFAIDSVVMEGRSGRQPFPTPNWAAEPMMQDTFVFPQFPDWPEMITVMAFVEGQPIMRPIPQPIREMWYHFDPPFEQARVQFAELSGVKDRAGRALGSVLSVRPAVVRDAAVVSASRAGLVEMFDAAGNLVLSLDAPVEVVWNGSDQSGRPLAAGIYFCRLTSGAGSAVCRVVLAR